MGSVGGVLEVEPDPQAVLEMMREIGSPVQHLAFPLFRGSSSAFERFGSKLADLVQRGFEEPLVHATFHPDLVGGTENAYRLIGLLRQAPDPFVQFIPHGLQKGGTVLAASREGAQPEESHADARFRRLGESGVIDELLATIRALKEDRARSYAALIDEIAS